MDFVQRRLVIYQEFGTVIQLQKRLPEFLEGRDKDTHIVVVSTSLYKEDRASAMLLTEHTYLFEYLSSRKLWPKGRHFCVFMVNPEEPWDDIKEPAW